jgi:hypothetical protein
MTNGGWELQLGVGMTSGWGWQSGVGMGNRVWHDDRALGITIGGFGAGRGPESYSKRLFSSGSAAPPKKLNRWPVHERGRSRLHYHSPNMGT